MADQFRKGENNPRDFMRQYKSLGNIGPGGAEVFAPVVALEAGSIGGGGGGGGGIVQQGAVDASAGNWKVSVQNASIAVTGTFWQATQPVSGTFWQATQPVSIAAAVAVTDNAGSLTTDTPQLPASLGQKAMANSLAVVVASDQTAVPVSGTFFQATQPVSIAAVVNVADNAGSLTVDAPVGTPVFVRLSDGAAALVGQKTKANSLPVTLASDQDALPVTDNAGSLTVDAPVGTPLWVRLSDGAAAFVGQKAMAASIPVVVASDQSRINVSADGDIDHDVANTLKNIQIAGHASPVDLPPAVVSANADRVRAWFDRSGANVVRRRKIRESYTAVYRLAEAAARLDQTFTLTANTNKQYATIHHTAAATKEIRLQSVYVWVTGATAVAPQGIIELRELSSATPPATGNPAITGRPHRIGTGAHEATCLYLPTTQGSEAAANSPLGHHVFDDAVSVATTAFAHPQGYGRGGIALYDSNLEDDEILPPTAPVGVYGGWAVVARLTGATALRLTVVIKFTEEIP